MRRQSSVASAALGCRAICTRPLTGRSADGDADEVHPQTLATGYRTSKVVGATVVNEVDETVGTIDDLIVTPGGQAPYAVLSVGGFLGLGTKYVVLPFTNLQIVDKKIILPGGTKDALKALPDFKYAS